MSVADMRWWIGGALTWALYGASRAAKRCDERLATLSWRAQRWSRNGPWAWHVDADE